MLSQSYLKVVANARVARGGSLKHPLKRLALGHVEHLVRPMIAQDCLKCTPRTMQAYKINPRLGASKPLLLRASKPPSSKPLASRALRHMSSQ